MSTEITIDIYSGRPNPVLRPEDDQMREILGKLDFGEQVRLGPGAPDFSYLGYRGVMISAPRDLAREYKRPERFRVMGGVAFTDDGAYRVEGLDIEERVLPELEGAREFDLKALSGPSDAIFLDRNRLRDLILGQIEIDPKIFERFRLVQPCPCGPIYEPGWWNGNTQILWNNNCYNYSTNIRTDTFAQPGRAAGSMYTSLTCSSVQPAALADDLTTAGAQDVSCPPEGHKVALVIWPGGDFHWYRKDKTGWWSHKPGGTPVTNRDNSGNLINDPRTADRGPYTDFCEFMVVQHGHVKIE